MKKKGFMSEIWILINLMTIMIDQKTIMIDQKKKVRLPWLSLSNVQHDAHFFLKWKYNLNNYAFDKDLILLF
jgi:hypothetical protein